MNDEALPYHLRADSPPLAQCDRCGRKSWAEEVGTICAMPQPDGSRCLGLMRASEVSS